MAIIYAVSLGHDQPDAGLTPLNPQPTSVGVVPGRRIYAASGALYEDTHHVELVWRVLEDGADYQALLVQLGLNAADTNNVTLRIRDDNFLAWRVNATVYRPEHGRELSWNIFARNLTILARNISEVST